MINIISPICLGCKNVQILIFKDKKKDYIVIIIKDGMIDVKNTRCLDFKSQPIFNYEGQQKGLYCCNHKKDGMIDVKNTRCLDCKNVQFLILKDKKIIVW